MTNIKATPMNYIGSKYRLLPQILPLFPKKIDTFVDLFCGGCNVGVNITANKVVFNDRLKPMIDMYSAMQSQPLEKTVKFIDSRIKQFNLTDVKNEDGYHELRDLYNKECNPLDLFVLVAHAFNSQIRFNKSMEFNTSYGFEHNFLNPQKRERLLEFVKDIQKEGRSFSSISFNDFDYSNLTTEDFVYVDPPYLITDAVYNNKSCKYSGWNEDDERNLLETLDNLNGRHIRFALSNVFECKGRENKILKSWAEKYHVHHLTMDYWNCVHNKADKTRKLTDEVLVTNYVPEFTGELDLFNS